MSKYFIEIDGRRVEISEEMVIKHNLHPGDVTPFTRCKIQADVTEGDKNANGGNSPSTADIIKK